MTTLKTALPLTEMEHATVPVGEHLNLDVPGPQHEPFQKQGVVTEGRPGLPPGGGQRGGQIGRFVDSAYALPAPRRQRA